MTAPTNRPDAPCVLVVDDDEAMTRLAQVAFRRTYTRVVTHRGAFGVLDLLSQHRPVVLVLDVMMPGLDGPTLTELIRGDPEVRSTRIVLWSAMDRERLVAVGKACGADGTVSKIAGPSKLVDRVAHWLLLWDGLDIMHGPGTSGLP